MKNKKQMKVIKIICTVIALIAVVGMIIYLFPVMKELSTEEGQLAFKEKVGQSGAWGFLILTGLQIAQVFLIIVPGEPVEILAGMCYGAVWGTFFIMATQCVITIAIFLLVRKFGKRFLYGIADKRKIRKIEKSKLFQNPKKIEYIMIILFLIPGTPKDLLVYIGGLLPIDFKKFVLISTFVRFPSVISSTLAGANMATGNWMTSVGIYILIFVVVAIMVLVMNAFDKDNTTEDALKVINDKK